MLRFGGVPAVLSNELITCLKENDDISGLQKLIQQDMSPGDKIVIIDGPFEGYIRNTSITEKYGTCSCAS